MEDNPMKYTIKIRFEMIYKMKYCINFIQGQPTIISMQ
jgi:hypothetical protein